MNKRQKEVLGASLDNEKEVLKALEKNYTKALADIKKNIRELQAMPQTQSKAYQIEFQKQLESQISAYLDVLKGNNYKTITEYMNKCYEEGFVGSVYCLQGFGEGITIPVDQEAVIKAVKLTGDDLKLSEKLEGNTKLLKQNVLAEMQRGFATELSYADIARNISNWGNADMNRSKTIARTEGHRVQCKADIDCAYKARELGCDTVKQWNSTLDGKTRESHQRVDKEWRELDKPFSNGLMYPGDPSGRAAEVVNCRCSVDDVPRWYVEKGGGQYRRDNITGEIIEASNYQEWKEKYYSYIDNLKKDVIINNRTYSYIDDNKWNKLINVCKNNETQAEHNQIWRHQSQKQKAGYVQTSNSYKINAALRLNDTTSLKPDDFLTIDTLNNVINKTKLRNCIIADRYCDNNFLLNVFGVDLKNGRISDIDNAVKQIQLQSGKTFIEDAFMSVSLKSDRNVFTDKKIKLKVLLDDGTKVYVTSNKVESEAILHTGTKYRLIDANRLIDLKGNAWLELLIKIIK